jgi:four helix bundle protein
MENEEFNELFRLRLKTFALNVIAFLESVPYNSVTKTLSQQLCRSATSVGANWRAFCRGRSKRERFAKICIVVEEADESQYWLDIFSQLEYGNKTYLPYLLQEITEIVKVTSTIKGKFSSAEVLPK